MANVFHFYIYSDPRTDTPFYIGKGTGNRANTHIRETSNVNKQVKGRIRNLHKSGVKPTVEVYEATNEFAAFWMERMLIAAYGRKNAKTGCLLNMTDGGEGPSGLIPWNKGVPMSEEIRVKVSKAKSGATPWNKGMKGSQTAWNKGKTFSEEHRRKLSEAAKHRSADAEARKALSERGRLGAEVRWGQ